MNVTKPTAKRYANQLFAYGLLLIPLAYFADCVLDAVLFEEGTIAQQFLAPTTHELAIRVLFSIFVLAAVLVGAQLLSKSGRLEGRLRQRNEDLVLANQELEEFSFTLSHDLRNMLAKMYASVGLLKEQCEHITDERIIYLIENISHSSDTMESQIESLLNLAMIASGDLNRTEVYLDQLVREITDTLVGGQPNDRITIKIQPGIPVTCDAKLMRLALKSLFSNALKYIPENRRGVIEFGTLKRMGETAYYVRDNGIGFDSERAEHLFDGFRQPNQVSDLPGSGIGLATVRRVVQRHGGRVWAEGIPDAGATFYFTLQPKP